jgi:hypothetical protein
MPGQTLEGATIKTHKYTSGAIGAFLAVVADATEDSVKLPAAAAAPKFKGFTMEAGLQNEDHPIHMAGAIAKATASAAIADGDLCDIANAAGQIRTAAPGAGVNTFIVCKALRAAANAGDVIPVLVLHGVMQG